jgi:hypothetical protein
MGSDVRDDGGVVGDDGEARNDGLEHLRAAAGELIQACRAVLDVAEELLDDPATVGAVADGIGSLLRGAADLGRRAAGAGVDLAGRPGRDHHDVGPDDGRESAEPSRVQKIRIV